MKKLILTFAAFTTCLLTANAQATRTSLYQEFTGENCGPCASTNPGLWMLFDANASKAIHITYMEPIPSSGPYYTETTPMNDALGTYYNVPFAPYGRLDGIVPDPLCGTPPGAYPGYPICFVQADIDAAQAITAPISISAVHYFNAANDSVYGIVTITSAAAFSGTQLKLKAAFTRSMNFTSPPGDNGESDFENVVRAMFPSTTGQAIASTWATGSTQVYKYSGKLTGMETTVTNYTQVDSSLVVWVQNDSAGSTSLIRNYGSVLQAAKSVYRPGALSVAAATTPAFSFSIYPNPAKEMATLTFSLWQATEVEVKVTDELGRTFNNISKNLEAGEQKIELPTNELPSGVYLVQMKAGNNIITQKLSVIK